MIAFFFFVFIVMFQSKQIPFFNMRQYQSIICVYGFFVLMTMIHCEETDPNKGSQTNGASTTGAVYGAVASGASVVAAKLGLSTAVPYLMTATGVVVKGTGTIHAAGGITGRELHIRPRHVF